MLKQIKRLEVKAAPAHSLHSEEQACRGGSSGRASAMKRWHAGRLDRVDHLCSCVWAVSTIRASAMLLLLALASCCRCLPLSEDGALRSLHGASTELPRLPVLPVFRACGHMVCRQHTDSQTGASTY